MKRVLFAVALLGCMIVASATSAEATDSPCDVHEYPDYPVDQDPVLEVQPVYPDMCVEEIAPATATNPTCENLLGGAVTIPGEFGDGIVYASDDLAEVIGDEDRFIEPGTYPVPPGEYHVEAVPQPGFEFDTTDETVFHLVVDSPPDCTGPPGPAGPPGTPGAPGQPGAPGAPATPVVPVARPAQPVQTQPQFTG